VKGRRRDTESRWTTTNQESAPEPSQARRPARQTTRTRRIGRPSPQSSTRPLVSTKGAARRPSQALERASNPLTLAAGAVRWGRSGALPGVGEVQAGATGKSPLVGR
jgi:hypothetical protein